VLVELGLWLLIGLLLCFGTATDLHAVVMSGGVETQKERGGSCAKGLCVVLNDGI